MSTKFPKKLLNQLPEEIRYLPPPPRFLPSGCADLINFHNKEESLQYWSEHIPTLRRIGSRKFSPVERRQAIASLLNFSYPDALSPEEVIWSQTAGASILCLPILRRLRFQRFYCANWRVISYLQEIDISADRLSDVLKESNPSRFTGIRSFLKEVFLAEDEFSGKYWLDNQLIEDSDWIAQWQLLQHKAGNEIKETLMQNRTFTADQIEQLLEGQHFDFYFDPIVMTQWGNFWQRQGTLLLSLARKGKEKA